MGGALLFLVFAFLPFTAIAQTGITINGTSIDTGSGTGWAFKDNTLTISGKSSTYTLSGTNTTGSLSVNITAKCDITLDNLTLEHNGFKVQPDYGINLYIKGTNSLICSNYNNKAGLDVPEKASITIDSIAGANAILTLKGGKLSAGLGSSNGASNTVCGTITINGGTIDASGNHAAGIGGKSGGNNGTIIINGGNITAKGGSTASAIGGGFRGNAGTIEINGGNVIASGGSNSAAIGGGRYSTGGNIEINGGNVIATGGSSGAAIGGGNEGTGGNIKINGGNVTAYGGNWAAAIGGGCEASGGNITIGGGTIKAIRAWNGNDIGDGYSYSGDTKATIVITGGSVETPSFNGSEPTNGTDKVYKVVVPFLEKNSKVEITGLNDDYGTKDIVSDSEGNIYLYLPSKDIYRDNYYTLTINNNKYVFEVPEGSKEVIATQAVAIIGGGDNEITEATNTPVVLERILIPWGWNTLVLPFDVTTEEVNETFGEYTKIAHFTNSTPNTIELNTDENNKAIKANEPVLIIPDKWSTDYTFRNRNIIASSSPQITGANGINFVGTYKNMTVKEGDYFIAQDPNDYKDKLWKSIGNTTLSSTCAYFTVTNKSAAKPKLLIVDGETTGIVTPIVNKDAKVKDPSVYNLSGQKVGDSLNGLPEGLYIVGGKKLMKK